MYKRKVLALENLRFRESYLARQGFVSVLLCFGGVASPTARG